MKVALAIPTCHAGKNFDEVLSLIDEQSEIIEYKYILDSSSDDETLEIAMEHSYEVEKIEKKDFSHAGTRTMIAKKIFNLGYDYLIFMTQDVYLQENALRELLKYIVDNDAGVVRGKQEVDLEKGNLFEYFSRKQNYGDSNMIFQKKDIKKEGINTIFTSDAFSIYDLNKLKNIDYFGESGDVSEDMLAAHKMIQAGYKIGYCSKAKVFHTHNYSIKQEYNRYKSIGDFYGVNEKWLSIYSNTNRKGINLAFFEIVFLIKKGCPHLIPKSLLRNCAKFLGFQIGKMKGLSK